MTDRRTLLVVTVPDGRRLEYVRVGEGADTVQDAGSGERLAELGGDLTAFEVDVRGVPHVVFAGAQDSDRLDRVLVQIGGRAPRPHRVKNRVWMTTPEPFQPGDRVSVCWQDEAGRELWRYESPPLGVDAQLPPVHGPSWTAYGPGT